MQTGYRNDMTDTADLKGCVHFSGDAVLPDRQEPIAFGTDRLADDAPVCGNGWFYAMHHQSLHYAVHDAHRIADSPGI